MCFLAKMYILDQNRQKVFLTSSRGGKVNVKIFCYLSSGKAMDRLPHTSRFFVAELQIFCRAQICRDINLPHTSRFFVVTNRV